MASRKRAGHPGKVKDITGQKFGRLTAIRRVGINSAGQATWLCICDCPEHNETVVAGSALRGGIVVSCGCYNREASAKRFTTHGLSDHPLFQTHRSMIWRVSPEYHGHEYYFDRGIKVCERWLSLENFIEDMMPIWKPGKKLTLERRDVNLGYSKENCYFATWKEQNNNKTNNRRETWKDESKTLSQWSDVTGLSLALIRYRLNAGWSIEKTLTTPANHYIKKLAP